MPERDGLANGKLCVDWAGPYLFEGMKNDIMARVGRVNETGQVVSAWREVEIMSAHKGRRRRTVQTRCETTGG